MESYRILKSKKFIIAVIFLLLFNCATFYVTQQRSIKNNDSNLATYVEVFKDSADVLSQPNAQEIIKKKYSEIEILLGFAEMENLKAEDEELYSLYAEEEVLMISENSELYKDYQSEKYSYAELYALADFYTYFAYQFEYQEGYQDYIDSVLKNGEELTSLSLFSDKNSFAYKSIIKSIGDYAGNKNIELECVNDYPIMAILEYQIGDFVLVLIGVFLALTFLADKNFAILLNTCKKGRANLKLRQIPILLAFSIVFSAAIYASELYIAHRIYPIPLNLGAPIQSSFLFADCIYHLSFLQFIVIHILFKAAVCVMIALVLWFLISISSNIIFTGALAGAIGAVEFVLYKNISPQSAFSFLRTFNVFAFFDYRNIIEYNLLPAFSNPIRANPIRADIMMFTVIAVVIIFSSLALMICAKRTYPIKTPKKAFNFLAVALKKISDIYAEVQSFVYAGRFEMFKTMHIGRGLLIIIAFLVVIGVGFNTNGMVFSAEETFLNEYYEEYSGELSDSVYASIEKMQKELQAIDEEFEQKQIQFDNGEISFEEYYAATAKSSAYDTERKAAEALNEQISRLEELSKKGITPILINEMDYNSLFYNETNQQEILILACVMILICSSAFSLEKTSKMDILNHCTKYGRRRLFFKKVISVLPISFVICTVSYLSLIIQNNQLYGLDHLGADIHNLQCLQNVDFNGSILGYLALNFLFEFCFITAIGLIVVSISAFVSQLAGIIVSACIFVLPNLLYSLGIYAAKSFSAAYQFNLNSILLENKLSFSVFLVHFLILIGCAVLLYLCARNWCRTKER